LRERERERRPSTYKECWERYRRNLLQLPKRNRWTIVQISTREKRRKKRTSQSVSQTWR